MIVVTRAPVSSRTPLHIIESVVELSVDKSDTLGTLLTISQLDADDRFKVSLQPGDEVEVFANNGQHIETHQVEETT